jgi:hypothetical protein
MKSSKPKKCRVCREEFSPRTSLHVLCGKYECAWAYADIVKAEREAAERTKERKAIREAKQKQKTLTEYLDDAQKVFNAYIRARDAALPCISCGTIANVQYCAGHFRTRKAASQLRFNEDNVHKQCNQYCNMKLSGNLLNYRAGLIAKIGIDRVESLMSNNEAKRWTKEEALQIKAYYKNKLKEIKNG